MPTPYKREQTDEGPHTPAEQCLPGTVGTVEHCLCGVAGLLCTGAILALWYPALVAVTQPLYVLSSTAVVAVVTTLWLLTWLGVEFVWEWRAGRLRGEL
ncbi:hypothetical protein NDI56_12805 [Haloarcula sp. S1CR25-12]|uniref:Uncharacterized protein n=1 Tax=Haloarcula saliterrae TaxID=2950534 RepID=A0ABU2FDE4_9EURY|nr:hypothetical protein [Haloarcula sp. S1CR25-12]MDS0260276.1 hypothetical protein [Haloarcula sp. S1CR25-12]